MTKKRKLIQKTSKIFLMIGMILAFLSSIALYIYTKHLFEREIEESLYSTEARIASTIKKDGSTYSLPPVAEVKRVDALKLQRLTDTVIYDPSQNEMELFKELTTFRRINNENYQITVRNMEVESQDFLLAIVISNISIFLLAFIFLFYFSTTRNIKLWSSFFHNLEEMKQFSVAGDRDITLEDSDVLEFSELKKQIELLTTKVKQDYENLKQFTEDVSHEMQTPLAIIQAKIENIINAQNLSDKQFEHLTSIQKDIQRLKQLNKRMTILTKIDKKQFDNVQKISISTMINEKIKGFEEMQMTHIKYQNVGELMAVMDPYLVDMLINNLLSNAIKHSKEKSEVIITSNNHVLRFMNEGDRPIDNPDKLFMRFYRESKAKQSTGLGLAIVKKICNLYGFSVSYKFENKHHIFSVDFQLSKNH
ncbi:sensor histidine kinase [Gaetbulibacter aestuarii]|uniref:histidine kinase n=1 Tax=Gaetbulibacter aestuarii TaxID=1502358 RepID=A0ABW7N2H6_9FLAO